jgi:hypothetical protein
MDENKIIEVKELFKKEFKEVDLSLGNNSIKDVYSILQKWLINPQYDSKEDLKDRSIIAGFTLPPKIETIGSREKHEWKRDTVFFNVKKVIPAIIEIKSKSKNYEIGRIIKGIHTGRHEDAEIQLTNELEKRLHLPSRKICLSVQGGGYISCYVSGEAQSKYLEFGGMSSTYGDVDYETFVNFVQPALRRYLDAEGLKEVEIVDGRGIEFFHKFM